MKDVLIKEYNNLKNLKLEPKEESYVFKFNFVRGGFIEILGEKKGDFTLEFFDKKNQKIIHSGTMGNNMWTRTNIKYYVNYRIKVKDNSNDEVIFEHNYNPENKRVYIHLDSKALGDTLAWFPFVEEFRKKWKCKMITSTWHNDWFKEKYPEIEFKEPGQEVYDLYAMYGLGWYYNDDKISTDDHPSNFRTYPLQKTATEILGLDYKEIKPKLTFKNKGNNLEKYVCIAPHASAHAKYWM